MSTKGLVVTFSSMLIAAALCLSGCASSDMKSTNDSMHKPMMKDSGKQMNDSMDKHDDMGGSM
jgi:hypothetical protein